MTIDRAARRATVDFTGTSPQRADNFNAPAAVTAAAVLYVFRTLVDADIPLNAGCLEPIDIVIPPGSMLAPAPPAAVAAGNVETSQAVTAALLGALGAAAASQGTMNNLTFGDDRYQYYETLCGGAGAGPSWDGCSAVHTHMTNSRLTDPEVLEWRYPVRVEEFRVRTGSGGDGRAPRRGRRGPPAALSGAAHGGDRLEQPPGAALRARRRPPRRLRPQRRGACETDAIEELPGVAQTRMEPGDVLVVETPGGGGYGLPPAVSRSTRSRRRAGELSACGARSSVLTSMPTRKPTTSSTHEHQPRGQREPPEEEVEAPILPGVLEDQDDDEDRDHGRGDQLGVARAAASAIALHLHLRLLLRRAHA